MDLSDFRIGCDFWCGGKRWRCTDVGSRVIVAISLEPHEVVSLEVDPVNSNVRTERRYLSDDPSWFEGPVFAVAEHVFDEDSLPACTLTEDSGFLVAPVSPAAPVMSVAPVSPAAPVISAATAATAAVPAFATLSVSDAPKVRAPDGSAVRVLLRLPAGSMARFELAAGQVTTAVEHRTVAEIWYVESGRGELWRRQGGRESTVDLQAGVCLTIPLGTQFQFRAALLEPLAVVAVTIPPWPGGDEADVVQGPWLASLGR